MRLPTVEDWEDGALDAQDGSVEVLPVTEEVQLHTEIRLARWRVPPPPLPAGAKLVNRCALQLFTPRQSPDNITQKLDVEHNQGVAQSN